ncbi:MAG: reductive dehalogenase [Desulfobacteraceae bacterium]|jgi:reductive dehalogenase
MAKKVSEPTYQRFVVGELERFDESNHVYSRVDRGEVIPPEMIPKGESSKSAVHRIFTFDPDRTDKRGYSQADYARRWAGRTIDYMARQNLHGREIEPNTSRVEIDDIQRMTVLIKKIAKWFGADLVGIAPLNRTWVYSHWGDHSVKLGLGGKVGDPLELPEYLTNVIVIAIEMDYQHIRRSPAVESATDIAYSKMGFVAPSLARFIQELGYHAMPSGNDTALSIPMAVDAGLGELGRSGILITEKYGSRVRLCKVFTDLPLVHDQPVDLGVQAFCETCEKCAKNCPGQALKHGERTAEHNNVSNNVNILKWPIDAERCIRWWAKNRAHCAVCIRVCPFNKPDTSFHQFVRGIIASAPVFNRFMLWADDLFRYDRQVLGDPLDEF